MTEKKTFYARQNRRMQFFARYWVGTLFLIYASPKILGTQFRVLESVYDTPLAQVSDFYMAWSFFAHSYAYQAMLGCAEITVGFLLLFRRTKTLGALCSLPITINILMVDYFFNIPTGALVVAATMLVGALYTLVPEVPRLKTLLWDEQKGSSSRIKAAASLVYGAVVFSITFGLIAYVVRVGPHPLDGAYKIERYATNGSPQTLTPGKYGPEAMMYIEIRNTIVLSLDGKNTSGSYTLDPANHAFSWTPDTTVPETIVNGIYDVTGDETTLKGKQGANNIEFVLKRIARESH